MKLLSKMSKLIKEVNCIDPSTSASIPWFILQEYSLKMTGSGRGCCDHPDGQESSGQQRPLPVRLHQRRVRRSEIRRSDDRPPGVDAIKLFSVIIYRFS